MYPLARPPPGREPVPGPEADGGDQGPLRGDVVFVSNAGATPHHFLEQTARRYRQHHPPDSPNNGDTPDIADLIEPIGRRLIDHYHAGHTLATEHALRAWLREQPLASRTSAEAEQPDAVTVEALAHQFWHPLNDALYRQQALAWVADAIDTLNREHHTELTLALYGQHWDEHPDFAPYHRGYADYTTQLPRITRDALVNLQVVPYRCTHQRLLDGLAAGGFFLIRQHPTDLWQQRLANLLIDHFGRDTSEPDVATDVVTNVGTGTGTDTDADTDATIPIVELPEPPSLITVREALGRAGQTQAVAELDALVEAFPGMGQHADPVEKVARLIEGGRLGRRDQPLPRLDETSFASAHDVLACLRRFCLDDPDSNTPDSSDTAAARRDAVVDAQRRFIAHRYTYTAAMRRVAHTLRQRLREEAQTATTATTTTTNSHTTPESQAA